MKRYILYCRERFPLAGAALYSGSLFYVSYCFAGRLGSVEYPPAASSLAGFIVLFLVFLHVRILDDQKDYDSDRQAYPDRMLSKGSITLQDLRKLLAGALLVELALSLLLGMQSFALWLVILAWSLLMSKEFFVPEFLNRHPALYLVSHQLLVPMMSLFAVAQRFRLPGMFSPGILELLLFEAALMSLTITYELARKTRPEAAGHGASYSHTGTWGTRAAVAAALVLSLAGGAAFVYFLESAGAPPIPIGLIGLLYLPLPVSAHRFLKSRTGGRSKLLEASAALYMLGTFIVAACGFCMA